MFAKRFFGEPKINLLWKTPFCNWHILNHNLKCFRKLFSGTLAKYASLHSSYRTVMWRSWWVLVSWFRGAAPIKKSSTGQPSCLAVLHMQTLTSPIQLHLVATAAPVTPTVMNVPTKPAMLRGNAPNLSVICTPTTRRTATSSHIGNSMNNVWLFLD